MARLIEANDIVELYRLVREELQRYQPYSHDADDLVQVTFLRIWNALGQKKMSVGPFERPVSRWYVRRTLRSVIVDRARREGRLVPLPALIDDSEEDRLAAIHDLRAMWAMLDEEEKRLLRLVYADDKSLAEVAELFGITEVALRVRLTRLRKRLREDFE